MAQGSDIVLHEQVKSSDTQDGEKGEKTYNHEGKETPVNYTRQVVYGLEDVPPWYATIAFGFQQFLASVGSITTVQVIIGIKMCMSFNTVLMGRLISTGFLICGIGTFLQSTFGCRLPIIQGSGGFLVAVITILDLKEPCPIVTPGNATQEELDNADDEWKSRMLEISGAILLASFVQVALGSIGCIGILLRYVGPMTITPTVALTAMKVVPIAVTMCGDHWGISAMTIGLIILTSQYLASFDIPIPAYNSQKRLHIGRAQIFQLFPIIIAIITTWILCVILTVADVFPDDPTNPAYNARTDIKLDDLVATPWLEAPYPGQWGRPYVTVGAFLGVLTGVFASILDSIGDYYACARLCSAPKPPNHAVNRGILIEGIACIFAGAWGTGLGMTSYSDCIGNIGLTKVGSRTVAQVTGVVLIIFAFFAKVGALFSTVPYPIFGGTVLISASMVFAVGLSNLQFIDLNSTRNLLVVGFSISGGFGIPLWLSKYPHAIQTGSSELDSILTICLVNDVFVGGMIGFFLDNTIPGTLEERGMLKWLEAADVNDPTLSSIKGYDLPFGMNYMRGSKLWRYLPFSPTFQGFPWAKDSVIQPKDHVVDNNHVNDWEETKIVDKESNRYKRWIKEAITIRKRGNVHYEQR
ncbi:solute carrier family 23 member 1-like [Amphiura filiformis]|uniref:solute carrier family 23 member 1-like n=1 Tax=Amphiura filiformis TaxID=82378 RepID=UPI003B20DCCA